MLTAKSWKPEALLRLLLSIVICVYAGSMVLTIVHFGGSPLPRRWLFFALVTGTVALLSGALFLVHRHWTLDNFLRRMLMALGCFYLAVLLEVWAQKLTGPLPTSLSVTETFIGTLTIQGSGLILILLFVREHGMSFKEAFELDYRWRQALLFGGLLAVIFLPVAWLLQHASYQFMTRVPHFPLKPEEQQAVQTLRQAASWVERVALGVVTILVAPVVEEMLFRGILYPAIKQAGFPRLALWGTSIVFAAVHFTPVIFLSLLALALLLVALYEKTGNLLAPITAHGLFNALNFVMVYFLDKKGS